ncbi:group XV phospholipase A2 [Pelomyxa schiedti]|nr:group XV phospholipase A2 [Pelomyxa schiedti]
MCCCCLCPGCCVHLPSYSSLFVLALAILALSSVVSSARAIAVGSTADFGSAVNVRDPIESNLAPACHPIVLVPGVGGSQLEVLLDIPDSTTLPHFYCKRKSKTWTRVWITTQDVSIGARDCVSFYLSMEWDNQTSSFANREGIQVRSPKFGSVYAMDYLDPSFPLRSFTKYYHDMIAELQNNGYTDMENMFGAGFDWRRVPSDNWMQDLKVLIETASQKNAGRSIDLVAHSMGTLYTYYFLLQQDSTWKAKYIHTFLAISPPWSGAVQALLGILSGDPLGLPVDRRWARDMSITFPGLYFLLPNPSFGWDHSQVLVQTKTKNYPVLDYPELFMNAGIEHVPPLDGIAKEFFTILSTRGFTFPGVPVSCIYSRGLDTAEALVYRSDSFEEEPTVAHGEGDGTVNLESLRYACESWQQQGYDVEVMVFDNISHFKTVSTSDVIRHVIQRACPVA